MFTESKGRALYEAARELSLVAHQHDGGDFTVSCDSMSSLNRALLDLSEEQSAVPVARAVVAEPPT